MRRSGARRRNAQQDRIREQRDVVDTLAHRGQMNRKRTDPEIQIGTELAVRDHPLERLVRGRDEPDTRLKVPVSISRRRRASREAQSSICVAHVDPATGRFRWTWPTAAALAATGSLTGLMTGMLGVGGGFIIVPMMRKLTDVSMHGIVATSLMVIALVDSGGVLATATHGATLPLEVALWFTGATAAGMLSGRLASHHIAARQVQLGFASILVCVALGLLVKAALM